MCGFSLTKFCLVASKIDSSHISPLGSICHMRLNNKFRIKIRWCAPDQNIRSAMFTPPFQ